MEVNWTRCDEELPKTRGPYWVYIPLAVNEVSLGKWSQLYREWWIDGDNVRPGETGAPTHYAKAVLPDPPAEIAEPVASG